MNLAKLKGKLVECGQTYESTALFLGISTTTLSDKINGKKQFYIGELEKLGNFLEMTEEEKVTIFLH